MENSEHLPSDSSWLAVLVGTMRAAGLPPSVIVGIVLAGLAAYFGRSWLRLPKFAENPAIVAARERANDEIRIRQALNEDLKRETDENKWLRSMMNKQEAELVKLRVDIWMKNLTVAELSQKVAGLEAKIERYGMFE
jgi:hypothetical protein